MNNLLNEEITKVELALSLNTENRELIYRLQLLKQYKEQGAVLHSDGYIRYPHKPTLLGYD